MATKRKSNGRSALYTYKSYLFKDKDPIIDAFRTARQKSGKSFKEVHEDSNVTVSTLRGWELGTTRSPKFMTMSAAILAVGGKGITYVNGKPKIES